MKFRKLFGKVEWFDASVPRVSPAIGMVVAIDCPDNLYHGWVGSIVAVAPDTARVILYEASMNRRQEEVIEGFSYGLLKPLANRGKVG